MDCIQLNINICLYCADEEIVIYSMLTKQTYLLSVIQSHVLTLFLQEKEKLNTVILNVWSSLCIQKLKLNQQEFTDAVEELFELSIINKVKCE